MDANLKTSLAGIAPYLWLFSLGTALTPLSPLSWGPSTWLLFIIPLAITVFAPTRTFSGPLRYAYLEYAPLLTSVVGPLFETFFGTFKTIPTLALPMVFFIPVLPILFFVLLPALPIAWHYVTYHYRRRLKEVTISVSKTTASLDLAIARVHRAADQARTYEKEALGIVSTTRRTASLKLMLHSVDSFDVAVSAWAAVGHTAGHAKGVVTAASEVVTLADNVRHSGATRDAIYPRPQAEILFERAKTAETAALHADRLSQQAQNSVIWSQNGERRAAEARQQVQRESEKISKLGTELADMVAEVEKKVGLVEDGVEKVRATLEQAVAAAVEGEMADAKRLAAEAEKLSMASIIQDVAALCSVADRARRAWVALSVKA